MIINAAGDALFNFLPLFLGYTAAKKFKLKPMLGLAIGAAMCYPAIQSNACRRDCRFYLADSCHLWYALGIHSGIYQ